MDIGLFREAFPEFADIVRYPDAQISLWSTFATAQVNPCLWQSQTNMGIMLYTAHEITIASANEKTGVIGGTPGQQSGPINTKTVGSVTVGYDTAAGSEKDGGYWNQTIYGKQFLRLARLFGAGAIQL